MSDQDATHPIHLDHAGLAKATGMSLLVAAVGLVLVVLPASYGIDPTGIGTAMGFSPDPELPDDLSTADENLTLILGPGQEALRSHQLQAGQVLAIAWTADHPLNMTLRGSGGPAVQAGTIAATDGPTTNHTLRLEVPHDGTYVFTWTNPSETDAEGRFQLAVDPPTGGDGR